MANGNIQKINADPTTTGGLEGTTTRVKVAGATGSNLHAMPNTGAKVKVGTKKFKKLGGG